MARSCAIVGPWLFRQLNIWLQHLWVLSLGNRYQRGDLQELIISTYAACISHFGDVLPALLSVSKIELNSLKEHSSTMTDI